MSDPEGPGAPSNTTRAAPEGRALRRIVAHPAVSVLLYLLLVDLAVETFLDDAAVWPWVAGTVVVYLAASAYVWRRVDSFTKTFLSSVVLFGLVTVSVWFPGGVTRGVEVLGLSTSLLLSSLSFLVLAFFTTVILRSGYLPDWARLGIALLGAYGLIAFGIAALGQAPYGALFHGTSFWSPLPDWLQGAVLASFVVIPAGVAMRFWGSSRGSAATGSPLRVKVLGVLPVLAVLSAALASITGPHFSAVAVSLSEDGDERVSEIPAYGGSVFATWVVDGIDSKMRVEGSWVRLDGQEDGEAARGASFAETVHGDTSITTSLSPPEDGWKPGRYRLNLRAEGRVVRSVEFVVREPETRVVLARAVDDSGRPLDAGREFSDDTEEIHAVVETEVDGFARFTAKWTAVETEDREPDRQLDRDRLNLESGDRKVISLEAPRGGFIPGEYRLDLESEEGPEVSVPFRITPLLPAAELLEEARPLRGFNVALAAFGGEVVSTTSQPEDTLWAAANLIDGAPLRVGIEGDNCVSCGWTTTGDSLPQEIVLSLPGSRAPRIGALVLDPTTEGTIERPARIPRHVEVWASHSGPSGGFERVGAARIRPVLGEQVVRVSPRRATHIKLRLLSNYGGRHTQLGEVKVIEKPGGEPSVLADRQRNLALPALGGSVVRYTSQHDEAAGVHRVVDGRLDTPAWRSAGDYLPQEIVVALGGSEVPHLDEIVLRPAGEHDPSTWPRFVSISVSTEGPFDGFREVGSITLSAEEKKRSVEIDRPARFAKIRILENHGGDYTALDEIELLEDVRRHSDGDAATADTGWAGTGTGAPADSLPADAREVEPNDVPGQANVLSLGRVTAGVLEAPGEEDYYRLDVPEREHSVLTMELAGTPSVRTPVELVDSAGRSLKRIDPGHGAGRRTSFSWTVPDGGQLFRVSQPPTSVALIWDASGSMEGKSEDLRRAVEAYISQVEPSERVNLIRFSEDVVEVLLPSFTNDRKTLRDATEDEFRPSGGTPFFDAVARGLQILGDQEGNKAIVVMTDGNDNSSDLGPPEFWDRLQTRGVRLYTIGLGPWLRAYLPAFASSGQKLLAHVAEAMNGRFFFARRSEQLGSVYEEIARELRSSSNYSLRPLLAPGVGKLQVIATEERIPKEVEAPPQVELIFDASGSMRERDNLVDGRLKIDVAKDVVERILTDLPDSVRVGLRVFGHRVPEGRSGDCEDSELVYPFGPLDRTRLVEEVRAIRARAGTTPIAYSLRQVAGDFGEAPGEKIVILVTDGKEECGGDVEEAASALLDEVSEVRVNVVGFALADQTVKEDMQRLAELTGGRFYDAQDSEALSGAIQQSLAVPYDALASDSAVVASGLVDQEPVEVPEGVYTVVVHAAGSPIAIPKVRVEFSEASVIELRKEGEEVGVVRRASP